MAGLIFGFARASVVVYNRKIATTLIGRDFTFVATVSEKPEFKKNQTHLVIDDIQPNYTTDTIKSQAYAILAGEFKDINRSDTITIRGSPRSGFGNYVLSFYHPRLISISKPSPPDYALLIRDRFI